MLEESYEMSESQEVQEGDSTLSARDGTAPKVESQKKNGFEKLAEKIKPRKQAIVRIGNLQVQKEMFEKWIEDAKNLSNEYAKKSGRYRKQDNYLNLAILILLAFTSGAGILSAFWNLRWGDEDFWPRIISLVLTVLATVFQSYQKAFNVGQKGQNYHMTAGAYGNFAREKSLVLVQGADKNKLDLQKEMIIAESELSEIEANALPI